VVAHDLSPADTAQLDRSKVMGFITDIGGTTSHTAIMARALEIPAVVGLEYITREVKSKDTLIVDGSEGIVFVNPDETSFGIYLERQQKYQYREKELLKNKHLPAETKDGHRVQIKANIELPSEVASVVEHGGEGLGLYRTEFLYLSRQDLPTEEEHFEVYKQILRKIHPYSATIRTFDLGGDKFLSNLSDLTISDQIKPMLGLRAIRICLKQTDLFKTQLRALLRASVYGKLQVMFPLISSIEELRQTKSIVGEVKDDLRSKNIPFDER